MNKKAKLTLVEWEIMEAIWTIGGSPSVRDVLEHLFPKGEKAYTTVQTMMYTLEKKEMLKREKIGLVNFFTPTKSRENAIKTEFPMILKRMFRGSVLTLVNYFLNSENPSQQDIDSIKELIKKKETELKKKTS